MRLSGLGALMYLLMTVWMVLGSVARLLIEWFTETIDVLPFIGLILGFLAVAGIRFGKVSEPS